MSTPAAGKGPREPDDRSILASIRALFDASDPPPAGLADRVRFAVALADLEAEAARLIADVSEAGEQPALARGDAEESRTITFDSTELTIMIRIDANADGTARVDGWLAPPRRCRVEMAQLDGAVAVDADDDGRFVFASVPRGTVRLVVRPSGQPGAADGAPPSGVKTVITPALVLLAGA